MSLLSPATAKYRPSGLNLDRSVRGLRPLRQRGLRDALKTRLVMVGWSKRLGLQ